MCVKWLRFFLQKELAGAPDVHTDTQTLKHFHFTHFIHNRKSLHNRRRFALWAAAIDFLERVAELYVFWKAE